MREISAMCVGSVDLAIQLRSLGVNELTLGRKVYAAPPADWELYDETVSRIGSDGVGVHVGSVDDIILAQGYRTRIHHLGVNFFTWFFPETRAALERAGIPIRFYRLELDLEDVADSVLERIHEAALPADARVVLSLLPDLHEPFFEMHREFRPWKEGPTREEVRRLVERAPVSICTQWHFRKRRRWFLEQLPEGAPITLIVGDGEFEYALVNGMDFATASRFVREVRRLDRRREHDAPARP
jgi:hypothetical protein